MSLKYEPSSEPLHISADADSADSGDAGGSGQPTRARLEALLLLYYFQA